MGVAASKRRQAVHVRRMSLMRAAWNALRKDRPEIARRWARLLVRRARKDKERRWRKAWRAAEVALCRTLRCCLTEIFTWSVAHEELMEEPQDQVTHLRPTQALAGPTNSSKHRRHWEKACARRRTAASVRKKDGQMRKCQSARAKARDEKTNI